jgi:hypothetical protein
MTAPANAPWKRLYDDIKIQIPGVLDAVLQQVTFSLFKDFCDKTNIWWEDLPITVTPNANSFPFVVLQKGTPNRLLMVYDPAQNNPNRQWVQGNVQMLVPGVITISYPPSTAAEWRVVVAKTPLDPTNSENYPELPADWNWVVDKYREALTFGILARLQMMPGKPYTNAKAAKDNNQYYISERSKARTDAVKANTYGGQRWQYPQSFSTVSRKGWT